VRVRIDRSRRRQPSRLRNTDSISKRSRARSDRLAKLEYVNVSRLKSVFLRHIFEFLFDADALRDADGIDSLDPDESRALVALLDRVVAYLLQLIERLKAT